MFESSKWITSEKDYGSAPRVYFRDLNIIKPLRKAVLHITAGGIYNVYVGNDKAGDVVFTPGWTVYDKHHMYQSYDITDLVAESDFLYVSVGSGWYAGRIKRSLPQKQFPCDFGIIAQIDLEYAGGLRETIVSDESWTVGTGNILESDIYDGEVYDANIKPTFEDAVKILDESKTQLTPQIGEYVVEHDIFEPKKIFTTPKGETVVDFGVNLTGYPFFEGLQARMGERVDLSFGEILDKDGNFYNDNYRTAKCQFTYICRDGEQSYKPHHTFYGFRYVRINEFPEGADPSILRAVDVYSDIERTGYFECGNEEVNQLFKNTIRGQKDNFLDIPTDCPQRDERLGWTGDAQVFCKTAMYNFNVNGFFNKWIYDMTLEQYENGGIPDMIPNAFGGVSSAWADSVCIIPWTMYQMYGNVDILKLAVPAMKKWVGYMRSFTDNEFAYVQDRSYGDWLGLDATEGSYDGKTDKSFLSDAFYAYSCSILAKAMAIIGEDNSEYLELYDNIVKEFKVRFADYTETQTACVIQLHFGLCDDRRAVTEKLVKLIRDNDTALTTGFVGTPYLLHALSENGEVELAYDLLLRREYPSWLYPVTVGATTIWEHWDGMKPDGSMWSDDMNSFNHYAYGAVCDWMYGVICGINPRNGKDEAGFRVFDIAPVPDKRLGYAKAELDTAYGRIVSEWKYEKDKFVYSFEIPEGTTAYVTVDGKTEILSAGKYTR
ncbi:MAG: family 78 glycoside hydrolase catalytic domain [Clostridia bacterium]|nr:family 78 glycoside hydrolase catalytic domain [Clostridia bacterium]